MDRPSRQAPGLDERFLDLLTQLVEQSARSGRVGVEKLPCELDRHHRRGEILLNAVVQRLLDPPALAVEVGEHVERVGLRVEGGQHAVAAGQTEGRSVPVEEASPWPTSDPHRRRQRAEPEARARRPPVRRLPHARSRGRRRGALPRSRAPPRSHPDGHPHARHERDRGGAEAEGGRAHGRDPRGRTHLLDDEGRPRAVSRRGLRRLPREADPGPRVPGPGPTLDDPLGAVDATMAERHPFDGGHAGTD